jgi:hypothetical protein
MENIFENGINEVDNLKCQIIETLEANPVDWKNVETCLDFIIAECEGMKESIEKEGGNNGR